MIEPEHPDQESKVANAGDDEGLFRRGGRLGLVEPEPDEQIRREAHQFPAAEKQQEAVRDDDAEHRGGEEAEKAEESRKIFVLMHVAETEDKNQQTDETDHHAHERGERIEQPAEAHRAVAEIKPREVEK